jgi:hypothetical protein
VCAVYDGDGDSSSLPLELATRLPQAPATSDRSVTVTARAFVDECSEFVGGVQLTLTGDG